MQCNTIPESSAAPPPLHPAPLPYLLYPLHLLLYILLPSPRCSIRPALYLQSISAAEASAARANSIAIAGMVIAVLLAVVALILAVVYVLRTKNMDQKFSKWVLDGGWGAGCIDSVGLCETCP